MYFQKRHRMTWLARLAMSSDFWKEAEEEADLCQFGVRSYSRILLPYQQSERPMICASEAAQCTISLQTE
jgi:hypothetical protein